MESPSITSLRALSSPYLTANDNYMPWIQCEDNLRSDCSQDEVYCRIAELQRANQSQDCIPHQLERQFQPQTLEPRMMLRQFDTLSHQGLSPQEDSYLTHFGYAYDSPDLSYESPCQPSAYQEQCASITNQDSPPLSDPGLDSPPDKIIDESDDTSSKPYARLIYEALMQTPGHRMMLREIYDWFIENTSKPTESGTNGWQNSIRHNLSMNQAFENDKSGISAGRGHARKANSIWMLTEDAIKNGVQSTTRYRKTGTGKKGGTVRMPAAQRPRSGARGGPAARRSAARTKRPIHAITPDESCLPTTPAHLMQESITELDDSPPSLVVGCDYHAATPPTNCPLEPLYSLPATSFLCDGDFIPKVEQGDFLEDNTQLYDYLFGVDRNPIFDIGTKIESN